MSDSKFTEAEQRYLQDLENLPSSARSRIVQWVLELVPSIGLFAYGLASDSKFILILGFLSLLYFAVWRMFAQYRGFRLIQSIYQKQLSKRDGESD